MAGSAGRHVTNHTKGPGGRSTIGRRELLVAGGAAGIGLAAAGLSQSRAWAEPAFPGHPFTLGVASGDPWPDGFVLWTRLAPEPLALDGCAGRHPDQLRDRER